MFIIGFLGLAYALSQQGKEDHPVIYKKKK